MSILNTDLCDIRFEIFSLVKDQNKTRNFIDEFLASDKNVFYPENLHVFYNIKTDLFTIHPKFGETIFVAYLPLNRYKFCSEKRLNLYELTQHNKNLVYDLLHKRLVSRVKNTKDDLLKIYYHDKFSKIPLDDGLCNKHGLHFSYQSSGFILPQHIQICEMKSIFHTLYTYGLNLLTVENLKKEGAGFGFRDVDLVTNSHFLDFRKTYFNELKSFLLSYDGDDSVVDAIRDKFNAPVIPVIVIEKVMIEIFEDDCNTYTKIIKKLSESDISELRLDKFCV